LQACAVATRKQTERFAHALIPKAIFAPELRREMMMV
jgi:hypothetical protein